MTDDVPQDNIVKVDVVHKRTYYGEWNLNRTTGLGHPAPDNMVHKKCAETVRFTHEGEEWQINSSQGFAQRLFTNPLAKKAPAMKVRPQHRS